MTLLIKLIMSSYFPANLHHFPNIAKKTPFFLLSTLIACCRLVAVMRVLPDAALPRPIFGYARLFVYKKGGLSEYFCRIYCFQVLLHHKITH